MCVTRVWVQRVTFCLQPSPSEPELFWQCRDRLWPCAFAHNRVWALGWPQPSHILALANFPRSGCWGVSAPSCCRQPRHEWFTVCCSSTAQTMVKRAMYSFAERQPVVQALHVWCRLLGMWSPSHSMQLLSQCSEMLDFYTAPRAKLPPTSKRQD